MSNPSSVPLGAVDLFHLHTHHELLAQGLNGNSCAMVVVLDGRVDEERLGARLRRAVALLPELRWELARDRAFRWCWRERPDAEPSYRLVRVSGRRWLDAVVDRLHEPVDGAQPWHVDLLRGDRDDAVVLRWFHPLTDARGSSRLMAWLGGDVPNERLEAPPVEARRQGPERILAKLSRRERLDLSRAYFRHIIALAQRPILSLHGAAGGGPVGRARALRLSFDEEQTKAFYRSLRKRAKLADTSVLLFAVGRMVDRALTSRGYSTPSQLVPVPLSLDAKQDRDRMFGNHLTMMMLGLDRDDLADEARAVAHLAAQRREIVRAKLDVAMLAALDMGGRLPARLYNWAACKPFGGERSSYVVSNPGELVMPEFLGRPVRDAFSAPIVLARPGFQVIADRFRGRLGVLMVFRENVISESEVRSLLPAFERDLLGDAAIASAA